MSDETTQADGDEFAFDDLDFETPTVVAVGNAFDGILLFGPFEDPDEAGDWAEDNVKDAWCLVGIEPIFDAIGANDSF